jgi:2-methylcitrate dehydratase PrpD
LAALLAERGFDGPDRPLEGVRGFLNVTGEAPRLEEVTEGLGIRWEALRNIHKPYPCGIVLNAVIDGCLELRASGATPVDAIASITLHGNPLLRHRADRPGVTTGCEAQISAQHAVAVTLLQGRAGLEQFTDTAVNDPAALALRRRVKLVDDPSRAVPSVRLVVERKDGTSEEVFIEHARGTDQRPLSDGELEEKLRMLAVSKAPDCTEVDPLIKAIWGLEKSPDVSQLLPHARPVG